MVHTNEQIPILIHLAIRPVRIIFFSELSISHCPFIKLWSHKETNYSNLRTRIWRIDSGFSRYPSQIYKSGTEYYERFSINCRILLAKFRTTLWCNIKKYWNKSLATKKVQITCMLQLLQAFVKFRDRKYGTRYPENTQVNSTITSGRLLITIQ